MTRELQLRILSGIALGAVGSFALFTSAMGFIALVILIALLMYQEWSDLTKDFPLANRIGGLFYVGLPVWSMIVLRDMPQPLVEEAATTPFYVLFLILVCIATDIGAYIAGKRFGKYKLATLISPGKTWEGAAGGTGLAIVAAIIFAIFLSEHESIITAMWHALIVSIASQIGDLFESWIKRKAGVKDSGTLIPGHGGILDRMDGLVFAAPVYALLVSLG